MEDFNPDAFLAEAEEASIPEVASPTTMPGVSADITSLLAQGESMQEPDLSAFDPDSFLQEAKEEEYSTPGKLAKTAAIGLSEGVAGPLATAAIKGLGFSDDEEMQALREINPVTHGASQAIGLGAGMFTGVGEGALLARAGQGAKALAGLSKAEGLLAKIGAEAIDQGVQNALFQGADEVSKMIINDPNATVENAIGNIGLATALGGVTGAAIGSISPMFKAASDDTAKFLTDFKSELKFMGENPNPIVKATKELEDLHVNTQTLKESLFGDGLKGDLLKKHMPELSDTNTAKLRTQIDDIRDRLRSTAEAAAESVDTKNASPYIEQRLKDFDASLLKADSYEAGYNAINDLKKALQADAKKGRAYGVDLNTSSLGELSAKLAKDIKPMLEDTAAWGQAGRVQKTFNEAFHSFTESKAEKDFLKTFTREVGGERVLDPAKLDTFVRQAGSPKAEIKNEILENYLSEYNKFAKKVNGIAAESGVDPLVGYPDLAILNKLTGNKSKGAEMAQALLGKLGDEMAGRATAASAGFAAAGPIGAMAGEYLFGNTLTKAMNGLARSIVDSPVSSNGLKSALDLAVAAVKGETLLNKAAASVFKGAVPVISSNKWPSDKDRSKLDKIVTNAKLDPESLTKVNNGNVGHYMPNHQAALSQTSATAVQYLASIKPEPFRSSPLDKPVEPSAMEKARYDRALDIAQSPQIVLQRVKDGTLQTTDLQDLNGMYPSLYRQMKTKLSNEIANMQGSGEHIPYATRMGLSLFLGNALDTTMQPLSIQAAQPKPVEQQGPQGTAPGASKNTSKLGKQTIDNAQTPLQAAQQHKASRN